MSMHEGQRLLGEGPSWTPKILVGTVVGACLATVVVASATSTASLYTAPAVPAVAQATSVLAGSAPVIGRPAGLRSDVAAAAYPMESAGAAEGTQTSTWAPVALMAAIPMALVGAFAAFRSTKKVSILDPVDVVQTQGFEWAMMATSGEAAVAKNYANALIELGQENKCLEQLNGDMENFAEFLADETLGEFFSNPMMVGSKQKEVIAKLCEEANASPITKNFLSYLVDKRRILQLPLIIKEFDAQFYDITGTQVATVTSAVTLGEEQLRLIANKLHEITKGKNVKIKSQVDPDLLAGFVLEYGKSGSQRIDLSLRGQLADLEVDMKDSIRKVIMGGVPAGIQFAAAALGINALMAGDASAGSGNIFDFGLTMPVQMVQFLLLMVFLEKTIFTPVGKVLDERASYIRERNSAGADNSKEIAALNAQAEALLDAARKDAAKEQDRAKKEAGAQAAQKLASSKAELDASLKKSVNEVQKSKDELWTRLQTDVLPQLADDIVNKLVGEEPVAA